MIIILTIINIIFILLGLTAFVWIVFGFFAAIIFLILLITAKNEIERKKNLKRLVFSFGGFFLLIVTATLYALVKIIETFFGIGMPIPDIPIK